MVAQNRAAREWEREHPEKPDPQVFIREILPKIQGVPLGARIWRGLKVSHPRHWESPRPAGENLPESVAQLDSADIFSKLRHRHKHGSWCTLQKSSARKTACEVRAKRQRFCRTQGLPKLKNPL